MREDKTQMVKYAMFYGLIFGLYWLIVLAFAATGKPLLIVFSNWLSFGIPVLAYWFTVQYRKKVLNNQIGAYHAWQFGLMLYFYATLIIAIPEFLFFKYVISPNEFLAQFLQAMQPATKDFESMKALLDENTITPISMVFESVFTIVFMGMILSIPAAFFAKKKPREEVN